MYPTLSLILFLCGFTFDCWPRSVHRPPQDWLPTISVRWRDSSQQYVMRNPHLECYPYFEIFNYDYFSSHLLPDNSLISYRYHPDKKINSDALNASIEKLLLEIQQKKKSYGDFDIIQNTDFNRKKACGLLVLKFKEHPFILKLFIENPKSFINPQCKGFEPVFLFYLGGGINRHLSGFTRIKNLEFIKNRIENDPYWSAHADVPRKWFWTSNSCKWFAISGKNMGEKKDLAIEIPATYAIIADAIDAERTLSFSNAHDRKSAIDLCSYLDLYADPNISNFLVEKNTHKLVIIDTEHFPSIVGFKEKTMINSYFDYFMQLISKCAKDMLFCTKKERLESYKRTSKLLLS